MRRGLPRVDQITRLIKRFMTIITAPVLLNGGRQVDYGFFCRDCRDEIDRNMHSKIKYTAEEIPGHIANSRAQNKDLWQVLHVKSDLYRQLVTLTWFIKSQTSVNELSL